MRLTRKQVENAARVGLGLADDQDVSDVVDWERRGGGDDTHVLALRTEDDGELLAVVVALAMGAPTARDATALSEDVITHSASGRLHVFPSVELVEA